MAVRRSTRCPDMWFSSPATTLSSSAISRPSSRATQKSRWWWTGASSSVGGTQPAWGPIAGRRIAEPGRGGRRAEGSRRRGPRVAASRAGRPSGGGSRRSRRAGSLGGRSARSRPAQRSLATRALRLAFLECPRVPGRAVIARASHQVAAAPCALSEAREEIFRASVPRRSRGSALRTVGCARANVVPAEPHPNGGSKIP